MLQPPGDRNASELPSTDGNGTAKRSRQRDGRGQFAPVGADLVSAIGPLYESGLTQAEVASHLGCHATTVQRLMKQHGIPVRDWRRLRGADNNAWKGGQAGYAAMHRRVQMIRGTPDYCAACDASGPGRKYEWANLSGRYDDPHDYVRLCTTCHRVTDIRRRQANGG